MPRRLEARNTLARQTAALSADIDAENLIQRRSRQPPDLISVDRLFPFSRRELKKRTCDLNCDFDKRGTVIVAARLVRIAFAGFCSYCVLMNEAGRQGEWELPETKARRWMRLSRCKASTELQRAV